MLQTLQPGTVALSRALKIKPLQHFLFATLVMIVSTIAGIAISKFLLIHNVLLVFLLGVLIVGTRTSLGPALWSSLLGFVAYNFFFTQPVHTLLIHNEDDVLTVGFLLLLSFLTGNMAATLRAQLNALQVNQAFTNDLLNLSKTLADAMSPTEALEVGYQYVTHQLNDKSYWLKRDSAGNWHHALPLDKSVPLPIELARLADSVLTANSHVLRRMPNWYGYTLQRTHQDATVVLIPDANQASTPPNRWAIPLQYIGQSLERMELRHALEKARVEKETERLRSALLSSVSHDLKTPLASMIGAASSLLQYRERLTAVDQEELLESILEEAERLSRYIENLLDMTRLNQGQFILQRDWAMLSDIVAAALQRLATLLKARQLDIKLPGDLPLLFVNASLLEQALVNVIENAARYTPEKGQIQIVAQQEDSHVLLSISDEGPGISECERERIFDMFYRLEKGDRHQGTGLGLAISKAIITAHGGDISAIPANSGCGTQINIRLTVHSQPSLVDNGER